MKEIQIEVSGAFQDMGFLELAYNLHFDCTFSLFVLAHMCDQRKWEEEV